MSLTSEKATPVPSGSATFFKLALALSINNYTVIFFRIACMFVRSKFYKCALVGHYPSFTIQ